MKIGGTFRRPSENGPSVRRRDTLRHPGPSIGSIDRDWPGPARTDLFKENRISVVPPTAPTRLMGASHPNALPAGGSPHPRSHVIDPGSFGHQQKVRQENGIPGPCPGRERRRSGLRLLAPPDYRCRIRQTHGPSSL